MFSKVHSSTCLRLEGVDRRSEVCGLGTVGAHARVGLEAHEEGGVQAGERGVAVLGRVGVALQDALGEALHLADKRCGLSEPSQK